MKTADFHSAFRILYSALFLLLFASVGAAQTKDSLSASFGVRTEAFRRLLFELRFKEVSTPADLLAEPEKSILIVFGDTGCLAKENFPKGLVPFVQRGGAVLIATDKEVSNPHSRESLSKLAGVRVTGEKLQCPSGEKIYENNPYCPFLSPVSTSAALNGLLDLVGSGSRPDLFRNPQPNQPGFRVATNAPSRLREEHWWGLPGGIHRLARLPAGCQTEELSIKSFKQLSLALQGKIDPAELNILPPEPSSEEPLFAVGGTFGKGRVLVLADHSIFINRMILPRDNNNLEFAANCLHWLRGGVSTPLEALRAASPEALLGQRERVLFFDEGIICKKFAVPLRTMPFTPPIPALVAAAEQTIARMEDRDVFNTELMDRIDELPGGLPRVKREALFALTLLGIVLFGYAFLWRGRFRADSAVPRLAHAVSQHEPRSPMLEARRRAMLRSGNVGELVHQLARQCLAKAGVPLAGSSPPRVSVKGGWWRRWRARRRMARLWRIACGEAPLRIRPAALPRWQRELEELETALSKGTIALRGERPA